jgi:hypothetical protein
MKEPLNFLRKAIPSLSLLHKKLEANHPQYVAHARDVVQAAQKAVKFVMPANGQIFDTKLDGLPDIIKLPFDFIIIEYECPNDGGLATKVFGEESTQPARKRIVYAEQQEGRIIVASIVAFQDRGVDFWQVQPYFACLIQKSSLPAEATVEEMPGISGKIIDQISVQFVDMGGAAEQYFGDDWERHAYVDMADESSALLSLIEALTCKNVGFEALPVKKNKGAQARGALPYDEYHTLIIKKNYRSPDDLGGTHRSPREHLRRGHIRRLPHGNVWINSTIVNVGNHGKIHKMYEVIA